MDVVKYLYHSDLLLEDEKGLAIIGSGRYVLSVGDKVVIKQILVQDKNAVWSRFPLPATITVRPMKINVN